MKAPSFFAVRVAALLALLMLFAGMAYAQTARTATISFTAPTTRTDGTTPTGAISYRVYQGLKGQTKAVVGTITTTTSTITSGLVGGSEYCWQVSAQEAGAPESALSNEACKAFAQVGLQPVVITVQ